MLANLLLQPRLLVPVFIGSRLVSLVDDGGDKPADPVAKWINAASIIVGLSVSLGSKSFCRSGSMGGADSCDSWLVYLSSDAAANAGPRV
jgi:hypothetical protein